MTIENGAEQAANDILLPDDETETCGPVEVEYEGKTYQLPPELRGALLRQADYTRKTQEVAQSRKALMAEKAVHDQKVSGARAHTVSLLAALAHEAIHLHQWSKKLDRGGEHNADFKMRARQVCRIHGFDPKTF